MNYYVKDGMVVFGDLVAAELQAGEYHKSMAIMGAEVIVRDRLSLRGDFDFLKEYVANYGFNFVGENEISVPFVFDSAHDALEYAMMWTLTKLDELKARMSWLLKNLSADCVRFLLLNNRIIPVIIVGNHSGTVVCLYSDSLGDTSQIRVSESEAYYDLEEAAAQLYLKLP